MSNLTGAITELKTLLDQTEAEIKSLQGGKKASAQRVRKSLQDIKNTAHELRKTVVEHKKAMPTRSRIKKEEEVKAEPEPEPKKKREVRKKKIDIISE